MIPDPHFTDMYEGRISLPSNYGGYDTMYDPTYWRDDVAYFIERPHKLSLDCPFVTIQVPLTNLLNREDDAFIKRLKDYILEIERKKSNFKDIYDGKMVIPTSPPEFVNDSVYWNGDVSFDFEPPNKNDLDCPYVGVRIPLSRMKFTEVSETVSDHCLREFAPYIDELNAELFNRSRPDKENGKYYLCNPANEVTLRNGAYFKMCQTKYYDYGRMKPMPSGDRNFSISYNDEGAKAQQLCLCIKLNVQFPFKKYKKTIQMMTKDLPMAVERFIADFNHAKLQQSINLAALQSAIRAELRNSDYCAFVANGSMLPRVGGTELPYRDGIPFTSPKEDEIEIAGVRGMGIKKGVTVITGGGYSGKSTLLDALSAGIYNHISGDGRELVITDESAVKISAEDGRSVKRADLSPFIKWIPGGDPADFSTAHASGSTSQASNIMEAINSGAKTMLIDEDISATNFMIRDAAMKELIEREPITPFTERVRELAHSAGVSTILVIGGSGEYLSVADTVIIMDSFIPYNVTDNARAIAQRRGIVQDVPEKANWQYSRSLKVQGFTTYPEKSGTEVLAVSDLGFIIFGEEKIDIRMLHNIVSPAQINAIAYMLRDISLRCSLQNEIDTDAEIDAVYAKIAEGGLDSVYTNFFINEEWLQLPRKSEVKAVINRMRNISFSRS